MGARYLIDTNGVIDYLEGRLPIGGVQKIDEMLNDGEAALSIINKIELLSFDSPNPNDLIILNLFIDRCIVIPLTNPIVTKTIDLRKTYKKKLPDTIIAATAFVHNLTIITRNESDFRNMTGLIVVNPHTL